VRALILSSLLTSGLIFANSSRSLGGLFAFMALLSTAAALILYFTVALAALELQRRNLVETRPTFLAVAGLATVYAFVDVSRRGAGGDRLGAGADRRRPAVFLWSRRRSQAESRARRLFQGALLTLPLTLPLLHLIRAACRYDGRILIRRRWPVLLSFAPDAIRSSA
jgi:amino acid transporter